MNLLNPGNLMGSKKRRGKEVDNSLGQTQSPPPNLEHKPPPNSTETDKGAHDNDFIADKHEMFASESACTAYLVVLDRTYHPSIGKPSAQIYLFVVEALCRAPSKSVLVPIAHDLLLKFHPPELTDQFVGALLQRNIHSLLINGLLSQEFLKQLFTTGQVILLAQLALQSVDSGSNSRATDLLSALFPWNSDSPGPSQPTHWWRAEKDRLFKQYNAMLAEDQGQSVHEYFTALLTCI
ncbi:unnamed protein product [Rhizoctonia solani]|uniref:Uncharacterized protein n=1 Tax=Rhizoctonia solani TaxID=456999 RepID=A0A8H3DTH4_9AGAM|nr:unnamed protein product [Rhizoctonia solani]